MRRYLRRFGILLLIIVLSINVFGSDESLAFRPLYGRNDVSLKWQGDFATVRINMSGVEGTQFVSVQQWRQAIQNAVNLWNGAAEGTGTRVRLQTSDNSGDVKIVMTSLPFYFPPPTFPWPAWFSSDAQTNLWQCPSPLPLFCNYQLRGMTAITGGLLAVRKGGQWNIHDSPEQSQYWDPESVVLHELGHVLGLDHSPKEGRNSDCSAVMFGDDCADAFKGNDGRYYKGRFVKRNLDDDDVCGLRYLYGTPCDQTPPPPPPPAPPQPAPPSAPPSSLMSPTRTAR